MALQINMTGGSPWGFKMTGGKDFHQPLAIGKVTAGGKAAKSGVVMGYIIEKVNGEDCSNLSHHEAQNKIKSSGSTLNLTLSKPKRRDTLPEISPVATPAVSPPPPSSRPISPNYRAKSPEYKPDPARIQNYSNPGKWQKEGAVTQSPALYAKTHSASRAPAPITNGDKPVTISPEIKQMIEEEELRRNNEKKSADTVDSKPVYEAPTQRAVSPTSPRQVANENSTASSDKTKAASNIGKFFQSSSAPRYGEPSFTKTLQDIARPLGDPAVLEVRLGSALPVPTIHWYHNNKPTRESKEKDVHFLSNGPVHTMVLGELTPELLGTYTCTIMNKYGSKSCRCHVTVEGGEGRHHSQVAYGRAAVQPTVTSDGKRVTASTSVGLYSNKAAQDSYHGQLSRKTSRDSNEESEVLKALREEAPHKNHYKTPSMKFLEDSLLPESDDL